MGLPAPLVTPEPGPTPAPADRWSSGVRPALVGFLWARLCVAAGFVVAHVLSGRVALPDGRLHLSEGLLTWDGAFYRALAAGWYDGSTTEAARFFPLFPAAARAVSPLFLGREDIALVVIANVSALAGAVVLWRLAVEVTGDHDAAGRSAWMVAVVPSAFVLAFAYSEGLSLLLVAATLLMAHRRAFWWVAALGLASSAVRPVGVLLVVPIGVEALRTLRASDLHPTDLHPTDQHPTAGRGADVPTSVAVAARLTAVVAPVVGLGLAMAWVGAATGDDGLPFRIQRQLRAGFRDPLTRLAQGIWDVARFDFRDVYNVAFAVAFIALVVLSVRRRQPLAWIAYSVTTLVVALSANNIDSLGRYGLLALPLVVALAQWADIRWRQVLVGAVGSIGLVWLTTEALLGRVIP